MGFIQNPGLPVGPPSLARRDIHSYSATWWLACCTASAASDWPGGLATTGFQNLIEGHGQGSVLIKIHKGWPSSVSGQGFPQVQSVHPRGNCCVCVFLILLRVHVCCVHICLLSLGVMCVCVLTCMCCCCCFVLYFSSSPPPTRSSKISSRNLVLK